MVFCSHLFFIEPGLSNNTGTATGAACQVGATRPSWSGQRSMPSSRPCKTPPANPTADFFHSGRTFSARTCVLRTCLSRHTWHSRPASSPPRSTAASRAHRLPWDRFRASRRGVHGAPVARSNGMPRVCCVLYGYHVAHTRSSGRCCAAAALAELSPRSAHMHERVPPPATLSSRLRLLARLPSRGRAAGSVRDVPLLRPASGSYALARSCIRQSSHSKRTCGRQRHTERSSTGRVMSRQFPPHEPPPGAVCEPRRASAASVSVVSRTARSTGSGDVLRTGRPTLTPEMLACDKRDLHPPVCMRCECGQHVRTGMVHTQSGMLGVT